MSLRLRLSLLTVGLLVGLLVVGAAFQYFALGVQLRRDEASSLEQRFTATVRALTVVGARARVCGAGAATAGGELSVTRADCIAQALAGGQVTVMVADPAGDVLAWSPVEATPPRLDPATYGDAAAGRRRSYYLAGEGAGQEMVVLEPLRTAAGRAVGVAQLSQPTQTIQASQRGFLLVMLVALGSLTLIALLVLPLLVGHALGPLHRVTEASGAMARGELDRRVPDPGGRDELARLARSFNEMAAAVHSAFAVRSESEAGMRRFVADASHELRTPLTTLQGRLDLLARGAVSDPEAARQQLAAMQTDLRRMASLVDDLLTLTRLDTAAAAGSGAARAPELVDLDALVADTIEELSVRAPAQDVEAHPAPPGQAVVRGDPEQLRRAVLNLATNALSHAPGGTHSWRTSVEAGSVQLSLSDEGPGFPASDLPRVFDRFYRGQAEAHATPGSGLGLAIVRAIVEAHGGTVTAANGAVGAVVTIRLPRAAQPDGR